MKNDRSPNLNPSLKGRKWEDWKNPGMGIIRHVDAGYPAASEVAQHKGVKIPMDRP